MMCGCGGKTAVVDRRGEYRRRKCVVCGARFSTREIKVVSNRRKPSAPKPKPSPVKHLTVPRDGPLPSYYKPPSEKRIATHNARKRLEWMREDRALQALESEGI